VQGRLAKPLTPDAVPAEVPRARAFLDAAVRWCRTGSESELSALIRSPFSGVAHDAGAAYATLASRTGSLLDAIDAGRLGVSAGDRDAAIGFVVRLRRARAAAESLDDARLRDALTEAFALRDVARPVEPARSGEIELCEPAEPESPAGVSARQKHFSASSLNTYAECARKWFYRYACTAIEDPGSSAAAYGTAFHSALEDFHGEFPRPRAVDEAAMRRRVAECVRWAFERNRDGFETAVEFELQRRRAQRTAQRYVDWLLIQEKTAPFEVVGREVPADLELGGQAFVGFIDRLDRDERSGGIGVVDYKTGSIASSADEYRDKIRRFRDFQLPFYYWARTAAGDRVTRLALVPLKDALLDVRPIVLEIVTAPSAPARRSESASGTIAIADLERARGRMIELSGMLASATTVRFGETDDPAACTYCAYAGACARRPPALPERFAR
jgi:RecB family exonuclease